jgi:amino acid adenylation domain-containing protein
MTDDKVTYAELQRASCLVAVQVRRLLQMHPLPCGLFAEKSKEMLFGMIGILKAGSAYVPMSPTFPVDRLCYIVCDSGVGAVVTTSQLLPELDRIANGVPVVDVSEVTACPTGTLALFSLKGDVPLSADDTFVVFYTSGSTGKPKGVELSHRAEATVVLAHAARWVWEGARVLFHMPFNFDVSVTEIFSTFAKSGTLVLAPPSQQDMALLHGVIGHHKPDVVTMVPSVFSVFTSQFGVPKVGIIGLGGEAIPVKTWMDLHKGSAIHQVFNFYGPTECSVFATYFGPEPMLDLVSTLKSVPIGKPFEWRECYVMAAEGEPKLLRQGLNGELWLAGAGLAKGYVNLPDKTNLAFVPHPFRMGERAYRTGDLCRWLNNGHLLFLGRIDTQVKLHGLRIELEEIECVLREVDAVVEAAVVVKPELHGSEPGLVAYISPSTASVRSALVMCREKLPPYMVPSAVETLDDWPRNAAGKIDRVGLVERFVEIKIGGDAECAASSTNDTLSLSVQMMDSMAQMRLVSKRYLERRAHVESLLGISALLMCMYHWVELFLAPWGMFYKWPLGELYKCMLLVDEIFVIVFLVCSAYINSISAGLGGQSDAFRFTTSDAMLVLVYLMWYWPVPELLSSLLLLSSGAAHYPAVCILTKHFAYRWFILTILLAKTVTVFARKVHLNHKVLLISLLLVCLISSPKIGIVNPSRFLGPYEQLQHIFVHAPVEQLMLIFVYVGTVHYGESVWQWLEQHGTLVSCVWLRRAMAVVALLAIRITLGCDMVSSPSMLWPKSALAHFMSIVSVPTSGILMFIAVPNCALLRFLGRNVLGVFLSHVHLSLVWCYEGITLFGIIPVLPSQWWIASRIHLWACHLGWAEVVLLVILLLIYSLTFCVAVAPLFQLLLTRFFTEVAKAWSFVAQRLW